MQNTFILIERLGKFDIVTELTDSLFDHDWRFVRYLKNSEVDHPEFVAKQQERELEQLSESMTTPLYVRDDTYIEETENGSRWNKPLDIY
jgi:hypothetical protein